MSLITANSRAFSQ